MARGAKRKLDVASGDSVSVLQELPLSKTTGLIKRGASIAQRYRVYKKLGAGAFGSVYQVTDTVTNENRAFKCMKVEDDQVVVEAKLFTALAEFSNEQFSDRIVKYHAHFDVKVNRKVHLALVLDKLGPSVYDVVYKMNDRRLPYAFAAAIIKQMLEGLLFLHETVKMTHRDIKPENIVFVSNQVKQRGAERFRLPATPDIRIIDFNCASHSTSFAGGSCYTAHYRAPEICLGLPYACNVDVWATGAMANELIKGDLLFPPGRSISVLMSHEYVLQEQIPEGLLQQAFNNGSAFVRKIERGKGGGYKLSTELNEEKDFGDVMTGLYNFALEEEKRWFAFCRRMLVIDATKRPSARAMLEETEWNKLFDM